MVMRSYNRYLRTDMESKEAAAQKTHQDTDLLIFSRLEFRNAAVEAEWTGKANARVLQSGQRENSSLLSTLCVNIAKIIL
eukprot:5363515-Amphidinium_carterae.1